jgi:hypothetical protein
VEELGRRVGGSAAGPAPASAATLVEAAGEPGPELRVLHLKSASASGGEGSRGRVCH